MNLQKAIQDCLSGGYKTRECRFLINRAHTIALAYLRIKAVSGYLYSQQGERLEDLAWDYIADLFERDQEDTFTALENAFGDFDFENSNRASVEQHFRRVIVTKVNDNIFRANGDFDPSLKKIIRNLKNAINNKEAGDNVVIEDGCLVIEQQGEFGSYHYTSPLELLEKRLCSRISDTMQIPEVMQQVLTILKGNSSFPGKISLTGVAICIRKAFVHVQQPQSASQKHLIAESKLHSECFEQQLEKAARTVRNRLGEKYLQKKVLDEEALGCFMEAAKAILRSEFAEEYRDQSQFESLKQTMPELTYDSFRDEYRSTLEYIVKKMRQNVVEFYHKDWTHKFCKENKV